MENIIDGKLIAQQVNSETLLEVDKLKNEHSVTPGLAVVLVGEDPASKVYVSMKVKKCEELGIFSDKRVLDKDATQEELIALVEELNNDDKINGILVQSPPPAHIDEEAVINAINPKKDVDCFHAENVGKMLLGERDGFFPCTPNGVMVLLEKSGVNPEGKHVVVLGRSNIVGKPMMALLMQKVQGANATVTVCHSRTPNIQDFTKQADIIIAAIGKPNFLKGDMVSEGCVVIDVGINRVEDETAKRGYKLVGDVDFDEVSKKAKLITPVPGGVGPMTIAMLMHNTVKACKMQNKID
jgi:methylenetetrahydrofolate dehydrogenase (NADP+)/methenyltetrahydrofolate cyclohydrolase